MKNIISSKPCNAGIRNGITIVKRFLTIVVCPTLLAVAAVSLMCVYTIPRSISIARQVAEALNEPPEENDGFVQLDDFQEVKAEVRLAGEEEWGKTAIVAGWHDTVEFRMLLRVRYYDVEKRLTNLQPQLGSGHTYGLRKLSSSDLEILSTVDNGEYVEIVYAKETTCRLTLGDWIRQSPCSKFGAGDIANYDIAAAYVVPTFIHVQWYHALMVLLACAMYLFYLGLLIGIFIKRRAKAKKS